MNDKIRNSKYQRAQTVIELAVFGGILVFVLGLIIQQGLSNGYQQNQAYKAMRMAMLVSYRYSQGLSGPPGDGTASRNTASIMVVEDRLTANSGKYGTIDRTPYVFVGSGTHSRNLFMPVEAGETENTPMIDVFVNGKYFPLSTARFRIVDLNTPASPDWDLNCYTDSNNVVYGCMKLYTVVPNHPKFPEWCPSDPCSGGGLMADQRFDLDRNGTTDVTGAARDTFAWQWNVVKALTTEIDILNNKNATLDVDSDLKEETILRFAGVNNISTQTGVDENGNPIITQENGVITALEVIDLQSGDLNLTSIDSDGPPSGFTNDAQVYTFVNDTGSPDGGTYLLIEEGRLFTSDLDKQFVRHVQKKDQADVIQRVIRLANDTGRFCDDTDTPRPYLDGSDAWPNPILNPVEVCSRGGCFTGPNLSRTCFDRTNLLIFVRSRIIDISGRKWITDISGDPTVEYTR